MKTGYSVYSKDIKTKTKVNTNTEFLPLPRKKFDIIYADPPWDYGGKTQFDKSSVGKEKIDLSKKIFISHAGYKYPTVKTSVLKTLNVQAICKDNCLLFMWTTNPHLKQAIELGEAWGFKYTTVIFVWNKMQHNPGQYNLSYCELCLLFKKGKIPLPRGARNTKQLINIPRTKHSKKPNKIRRNIDKMFPTQAKIELFARRKSKNWTTWGLEV